MNKLELPKFYNNWIKPEKRDQYPENLTTEARLISEEEKLENPKKDKKALLRFLGVEDINYEKSLDRNLSQFLQIKKRNKRYFLPKEGKLYKSRSEVLTRTTQNLLIRKL